MSRLARRFRDLPLLWKLLVPSVVVVLIAGSLGGAFITRDLSERARGSLNEVLLQASLKGRAVLQSSEAYLLESASFAANVQAIDDRVRAADTSGITDLLRSVVALKSELDILAAVAPSGRSIVEFERRSGRREPTLGSGTEWGTYKVVRAALTTQRADRAAAVLRVGDRSLLAIASPICSQTPRCAPVGVALAGRWLDDVLRSAGTSGDVVLAVYDDAGRLLAKSGTRAPSKAAPVHGEGSIRRTQDVAGDEVAAVYSRLDVGGDAVLIVGANVPTAPTLGPLRATGLRLFGLMMAALLGIVGVAALVSRLVLAQVRELLGGSRALGRGDLGARTEVKGADELGELAMRFNEMAEQLQASHDQQERTIAERTEEIGRLLRQRTEFFASLSHELRTPLAVIMNRTTLMLDDARRRLNRGDRSRLDVVRRSADDLLAVVNDILELARAESGGLDVIKTTVDLNVVADQLRSSVTPLAKARDVRFAVEIRRDAGYVSGDPRRVRDVLLNLAENALKYTPSGGTVDVAATKRGRSVDITVSDSGVGIPASVGSRIFEPFYRVPGTEPQHGDAASGLGLALAKRLVDAQGGKITYESSKDGTTFHVTLRAARNGQLDRR